MKASKRRVVVTGIGVVSPIGIGASAFWDSVKKGTNGIDNITLFDASDIKVKLNDNQKVYFENIMKIFDNNPNEIKITDIVNQLGFQKALSLKLLEWLFLGF